MVLVDVGPNLGAINRVALLAADYVVTPLAPDLYSVQGLRTLGPTLVEWRRGWQARLAENPDKELSLPQGAMVPAGYIIMQTGMRLNRPVLAYERWAKRMPGEYAKSVLGLAEASRDRENDPHFLGLVRHFQSLMPLAQDAQKPMFSLKPGDGAVGAHLDAVRRCREEFFALATRLWAATPAVDSVTARVPAEPPQQTV